MRPDLAWPLNVPVLTDGVVTLRAHAPADIDRIVETSGDPEMIRWTPISRRYRREDAESYALAAVPRGWDSGVSKVWAIEHYGEFVGQVQISGAGPIADLGFSLHPDARGHGLMRRAVTLAIDHAFATGTEVVRGTCAAGNLASLHVVHACGFSLDAAVPDRVSIRDGIHDAWLCSIRDGDSRDQKTIWRATTFETDRFRLRPLAEHDDPRIAQTLDDPVSRRYLFERPSPLTHADAARERLRKWWTAARGETCTWAVVDDDDCYLADITLLGIDDVVGAEVGFYTHPDARGSGVLSEAFGAVVRHAFDDFGLRRLTLFAAESNTGSVTLAEKAGFRHFGTQELAARSDGIFEDLLGFELFGDQPR